MLLKGKIYNNGRIDINISNGTRYINMVYSIRINDVTINKDSGGKIEAIYRLIIYTLLGSWWMLLLIKKRYGSSRIELIKEIMNVRELEWYRISIMIGIKIPIYPLHGRLPKVHVEAPISNILAGI